MNLWTRFTQSLRRAARRALLTVEETETYFTTNTSSAGSSDRERYDYDREEILRLALEAWRVNPLARRIVGLTTQYVVGGGIRIRADEEVTHKFLDSWWNHRLNQLGEKVYEWCDELSRAGELFFLISTDVSGMSYIRAVPASSIDSIETAENDVQQELSYTSKVLTPGDEPKTWPAYSEDDDV